MRRHVCRSISIKMKQSSLDVPFSHKFQGQFLRKFVETENQLTTILEAIKN